MSPESYPRIIFSPKEEFWEKTTNIIVIYLLAPFIEQNLTKII